MELIIFLLSSRKVARVVKSSKNRYELLSGLMPVLLNDFFKVRSTNFDRMVEKSQSMQDILSILLTDDKRDSNVGDKARSRVVTDSAITSEPSALS